MSNTTPSPTLVKWGWTYSWDAVGNLLGDGEDTYQYDRLGRLTQATVKSPSGAAAQTVVQSFGYDAFGNHVSGSTNYVSGALLPKLAQPIQGFAFSTMSPSLQRNQLPSLTASGALTGADYDAQGNMIQVFARPGDTTSRVGLSYDSLGRTTTISSASGTEDYTFDDSGLRIRTAKRDTGAVTYRIYNEAHQLVATYEKPSGGNLAWASDVAYLGTKEVAEFIPGKQKVTLCDHLGTPRFIWDGVGTVERQKYLPFGEMHPSMAAAGAVKGYTNHEQTDPSGLIYMQARFCLPMYHRFAAHDPAKDQHLDDTRSWNIYVYARNNPLSYIDGNGKAAVFANEVSFHVYKPRIIAGLRPNEKALVHFSDRIGGRHEISLGMNSNPSKCFTILKRAVDSSSTAVITAVAPGSLGPTIPGITNVPMLSSRNAMGIETQYSLPADLRPILEINVNIANYTGFVLGEDSDMGDVLTTGTIYHELAAHFNLWSYGSTYLHHNPGEASTESDTEGEEAERAAEANARANANSANNSNPIRVEAQPSS